jgi:stage V sporulation protein R
MNEGWASFWHAELMLNYEDLTAAEHMDFSKVHSGVVSAGQGGSMNPYYVGFRIFGDIKKRWDEYHEAGKKDAAFMKSGLVDQYDDEGHVVMSKMDGSQKLLQVRADDDDVSFVRNYLTRDLAQDMKLFRYGMRGASSDPDEDDIILKSRDLDKIIEAMTSRLHNYGAPPIYIEEVRDSDRSLVMVHDESDKTPLDEMYAKETLKYVAKTWGHKVLLKTRDRFGKAMTYVIDEKSEVKNGKDEDDQTIVEVSL